MKFCNHNPELFVSDFACQISYFFGLIQLLTSICVEIVNIYILAYQVEIEDAIIYFVMLHNLSEVSEIYFHAQHHKNPLFAVMDFKPTVQNRACDIVHSKRSCFHRYARYFYRFIRSLYVSVNFYMFPYTVLWVQWYQSTSLT